jgi:hypothetical protein
VAAHTAERTRPHRHGDTAPDRSASLGPNRANASAAAANGAAVVSREPARAAVGAQYMEAGVAHVLDRDLNMPPGTFEAVRTLARVGAAVTSAPRPFPVVVYSPGNGSWRNASTALVEELVSHGFIVVTIDHPYDGEAVEFPDGTIALAQPLRQPNPALSNPLAQWDASVQPRLIVRVADVRFVLDALAAINAGRNPDAEHRPLPAHLAGALDLSRTGMFGHSLGAATTIEVMREDQRVRVGFMMDGPVPRVARNTRFDRPIILVRSDNAAIGELAGPSWRYFAPGLRGMAPCRPDRRLKPQRLYRFGVGRAPPQTLAGSPYVAAAWND